MSSNRLARWFGNVMELENGVMLLIRLLLVVFLIALWGYTAQSLWFWFIVPLGMNPITFFHAIGIGLFVSMFSNEKIAVMIARWMSEGDMRRQGQMYAVSFLHPMFLLFFGWVFHFFV